MADSDSDYVASSGDEAGRGGKNSKGPKKSSKPRERERWEEISRAWDVGLEDDNIESTVAELLEAGKKRRYDHSSPPLIYNLNYLNLNHLNISITSTNSLPPPWLSL
jgi:hypothetical protein